MGYQHTNSKGTTYYLKSTEVTLRGGKLQTLYFFVKDVANTKGQPTELPDTKEVRENSNNGFLTLRNRVEDHDQEHLG